MSLLLETTVGDLVIDLDIEGSPELCRNILKLAKARYYTSTLIYHVQLHRFCQLGDPRGDGSGGACFQSLLLEATKSSNSDNENEEKILEDLTLESSTRRFMQSKGRYLTPAECQQKGQVVATELSGIPHTIGSQFLITIDEGSERALDGYFYPNTHSSTTTTTTSADTNINNTSQPKFLSLGKVVEDPNNVLDQIHAAYCDTDGRPYADIRIHRALVIHDPFEDPVGMEVLLRKRGVAVAPKNGDHHHEEDEEEDVTMSPTYERPLEERVPHRILASQLLMSTGDDNDDDDAGEDPALIRAREEEIARHEATSRAVVLEVLGDLPSADIQAPENVLFVCKINPITEDEDLELIFSRFDPNVKADIIRDAITGDSLQYAFVEFSTPQQCAQAYFKMNNALVDDRRIKVDFSQSVSHVWDKYNQRMRTPKSTSAASKSGPSNPKSISQQPQRQPQKQQGQGRGHSRQHEQPPRRQQPNGRNNDERGPPQYHGQNYHDLRRPSSPTRQRQDYPPARSPVFDEFGRRLDWDSGPRRNEPPPSSSRNGPRERGGRGNNHPSFREHEGRGNGPDSNSQFRERGDGRGNVPVRHFSEKSGRDGGESRPRDGFRDNAPGGHADPPLRERESRREDVESRLGSRERDDSKSHRGRLGRRPHKEDDNHDRKGTKKQSGRSEDEEAKRHEGSKEQRKAPDERRNGDDESRSRRDKERGDQESGKDKRRRYDSDDGNDNRDRRSRKTSRHRHRHQDDDEEEEMEDSKRRHRRDDEEEEDRKRGHRKKSVSEDDKNEDESRTRHRKRSKDDEDRRRKRHRHDSDDDDDDDLEKRHRKHSKDRDEDKDDVDMKQRHRHRDDDDDTNREKRRRHEDRDRRHKHHRDDDESRGKTLSARR